MDEVTIFRVEYPRGTANVTRLVTWDTDNTVRFTSALLKAGYAFRVKTSYTRPKRSHQEIARMASLLRTIFP